MFGQGRIKETLLAFDDQGVYWVKGGRVHL